MSIDRGQQANLDGRVYRLVWLETRRGNGHAVGSWLQVNDAEIPGTVGFGSLLCIGSIVDNGDGSTADDGVRGIDYRAPDGAIDGRLGAGGRGNHSAKQDQQGEDTDSINLGHLALFKNWGRSSTGCHLSWGPDWGRHSG